MRDSGFRVALFAGLLDERHRRKMGEAIWLFAWLIHRQTKMDGLVLGGQTLSYKRIASETGYPLRSLRRWMKRLARAGYIEVAHGVYKRLVVRVLNQKKYGGKQWALFADGPRMAVLNGPNVADIGTKNGRSKDDIHLDIHKEKSASATPGQARTPRCRPAYQESGAHGARP